MVSRVLLLHCFEVSSHKSNLGLDISARSINRFVSGHYDVNRLIALLGRIIEALMSEKFVWFQCTSKLLELKMCTRSIMYIGCYFLGHHAL